MTKAEGNSLIVPPNFIERASNRIFQEFSADAEDWASMAGPLRMYPWSHFVENPNPEEVRRHKADLEKLIAFGEFLNITTSSPAFPDKEIAAMVSATLRMLKDDLAMWHGNDLTDSQAEELMQKCFPEWIQDLEALIKAYLALGECDLPERQRYQADYDALLEAALQNVPGVVREVFGQGIRRRAQAFLKAQSHPPTLPPQAWFQVGACPGSARFPPSAPDRAAESHAATVQRAWRGHP